MSRERGNEGEGGGSGGEEGERGSSRLPEIEIQSSGKGRVRGRKYSRD